MKHFRIVKDFLWEHKSRYLIGVFWLLMVDVIQMIIPKIIGTVADGMRYHTLDSAGVLRLSLIVAGIAVFSAFSRFMWRIYVMGTARKLEYVLRNRLYSHLQTLSTNYFNHHKTGDLMAHATNDINAVRMALGPGIVMLFDPFFLIVFTVTMMVYTVGWSLTFWSLLPLPVMIIVSRLFGKMIHNRFSKVQEAFSDLTDRVQENVSGMRVVQSFVQEDAEITKFTQTNQNYFDHNMRLAKVQSVFMPLVQFISTLSFMIALSYGGYLVVSDAITLGEFVSFDVYLALLTWPMMALGWVINIMQRGTASLERLSVIFDTKPEIVDPVTAATIDNLQGDILIENMTFVYPGTVTPALKNISLQISAGTSVGIIGRTGAGKTTLVNLLLRLYDITEGSITMDQVSIRKLSLESLRQQIGYVPQDNFLFSKTIRENIAFSDPHMTDEQIHHVAKISCVHDNIIDFPMQYDTMLGERGVTLSGGQKQRVSIARAVAKDPRILILDDSLSAVDTRTEETILQELYPIISKRTTLFIAHRISTIQWCDQIVVLDQGEVVQQGTHNELLNQPGLYLDLYQKQLLEEQIAAGE